MEIEATRTGDYKNPPVAEAVCQFTFFKKLDPFYEPLVKGCTALTEMYGGRILRTNLMSIEQAGSKHTIDIANEGLQFHKSDGSGVLNLTRDYASISVLAPYCGGTAFLDRIRELPSIVSSLFNPLIRAVSMKYIDSIAIGEEDTTDPWKYLSSDIRPYPPGDGTLNSSTSVTAFRDSSGFRHQVTIHVAPEPDGGRIVLDHDVIADLSTPAPLDGDLISIVTDLKRVHREEFEKKISDKARRRFNE